MADVLQNAFTSGELSPSLRGRIDLEKYRSGCATLRNFKVQPHGGAVKRPGTILLDELPGEAALIRFVFNSAQTYCLAFGEKWLRVYVHQGPVLNSQGQGYEIKSPYTLAQARQLSVAQSADVLFIAAPGVAPYLLKRHDHNDWRFEKMKFVPPLPKPSAPTVAFYGGGSSFTTSYTYYVSAVTDEDKESELSDGVTISGPSSNNWQAGSYVGLSWPAVEGAVEYRLYKSSFGGRPGFLAVTDGLTFNDNNVTPSLSEGAPTYVDPFPEDDFPRVVTFYEQRLVFASSPNRPQTIWMSKSGDFFNFARYRPLTDDSPVELTIASAEVSSLCWLATLRTLVMGSADMEWEISSSGGPFTARTAKASPQSHIGSAAIPSLIVNNSILHVTRSGAQVRDLKYDFGADSYQSVDLTIMAAHLLEKHCLTDWAYQRHPDSIIWAVRSDGALLGLTYQSEHQVFAWHRHDTQGRFLSVCSVPYQRADDLFLLVERGGHYFMERQAEEYIDGDVSRSVFLDCALIYDKPGRPVKILKGLDHLEGREVGVLSGGAVENLKVVKGGAISLDCPSPLVIVGLPFRAELETMPVEIVTQEGTSVAHKKALNPINIYFHNTVGAKVGHDFKRMEQIKWRQDEPYGTPPRPFTGFKEVVLPSLGENIASVCLTSDEPLPMTVLNIVSKVQVYSGSR